MSTVCEACVCIKCTTQSSLYLQRIVSQVRLCLGPADWRAGRGGPTRIGKPAGSASTSGTMACLLFSGVLPPKTRNANGALPDVTDKGSGKIAVPHPCPPRCSHTSRALELWTGVVDLDNSCFPSSFDVPIVRFHRGDRTARRCIA